MLAIVCLFSVLASKCSHSSVLCHCTFLSFCSLHKLFIFFFGFDINARGNLNEDSYILYSTAGFDAVAEGHPLLVVCVLPRAEDVLETLEVGSLIDHPHTALHLDGVASVEVCVQVSTVAAAVVAAALEILLLKKCDLWKRKEM